MSHRRIGVLGGMGPAATADFMHKLVLLTPASCDQEHLPVMIANLPHIHDRSRAILGQGEDPWPQLEAGIELMNRIGVGVLVIPCNSSHHWFDRMSACSEAPVLHIASASVSAIAATPASKVAIFATRGVISSGFYQQALARRDIGFWVPGPTQEQEHIDSCIRLVKAGRLEEGGRSLELALRGAQSAGADTVILGCTELPLASQYVPAPQLTLIDSSLELARAAVAYGLERRWNTAPWIAPPD
ncbi:aspartate/glutamate racemase family protein [Caenimonas terrae]|uniref:Aspartate/glutamate racemase family protein n=1 Tax=Caenimonas terrae TaxID=696074 RepID=A0ABW0N8C4_9BURK